MLRGAAGLFNGAGLPGGIHLTYACRCGQKTFLTFLGLGSWSAKRGEIDDSTPLNEAGAVRGCLAVAIVTRDKHVDYANSERRWHTVQRK